MVLIRWASCVLAMVAAITAAVVFVGGPGELPMRLDESASTDGPSPSFPPLVLVPGFKGSALSGPQGRRRWLTGWQGLGLRSHDLRLPLRWEGDVQQLDGLVPNAPLRTVARQNVYAPFLDWAAASGRSVYSFPYDWRRDNLETTDRFVEFLESVSQERGGQKIQVVGHSMGGLIGFVALNRRPDLFHSILLAGVPFGPLTGFLEDMHAGTAVGLNRRILSPEVLFTFVSPYCLFSLTPTKSDLEDENGNTIVHDWYAAADWERHKLGIFGMLEPAQITDEQRLHLRNALARAREFRTLFVRSNENSFKYPPIAVLASDSRKTLSTIVKGGPRAVRGWDFREAPRDRGDGRVPFERALPPKGVPYEVYKTAREHGDLLNDTYVVSWILGRLSKTVKR